MKPIGWFTETGLAENKNGSIYESLVDAVDYDKDVVCSYLESHKVIAICFQYPRDCVTGEIIDAGYGTGFQVRSDGEYYWGMFLPYHIKKYDLRLPKEFIEKCIADCMRISRYRQAK